MHFSENDRHGSINASLFVFNMCGILFLLNPPESTNFASRLDTLKPRGPDEYRIVMGANYIMGHTRNCITNPMKGKQPIESGEWLIVHNGEIYNGMPNKESDSYYILKMLQEHGPLEAPRHLDGIFGYVAYNLQTKTFYAARDPIGVIPMYIARHDESVWISNEIKALAGLSPECIMPGTIVSNGDVRVSTYVPDYKIGTLVPRKGDLRRLLVDACQKRMRIDVPWGLLLSGGLDSSIIAGIVQRNSFRHIKWVNMHTFSIGLRDSSYLPYARKMATSLGSWHHEYIFEIAEGIQAMREVIYALETYDVTTIRAGIPMWILGNYVRKCGVKVLFSGEGADELFAGYMYNKFCPNVEEMAAECKTKMDRLHYHDALRANKALACHGIECRVPFLDKDVVNYAMNELPPVFKLSETHPDGPKQTKWFLRQEFAGHIDERLRVREKEQFSDGVGTWIEALKEYAETTVLNFDDAEKLYPHQTPKTKEAMMYRQIFTDLFGDNQDQSVFYTDETVACSSERGAKWNDSFAHDPSAKNIV